MYLPNLFYDICAEPLDSNIVLQQLDITLPLASQNLSIINYDYKDLHQNIQQIFFKYLAKYYEECSVTVFDVLKHHHCQNLIITKNGKFVGGALYILSRIEGSFVFFTCR